MTARPPRPLRREQHEDLGQELERDIERVRATIESSEKQLRRIRQATGRNTEDRKGGQSLLRMRADIDSMATQLRVLRHTRQNGPPEAIILLRCGRYVMEQYVAAISRSKTGKAPCS